MLFLGERRQFVTQFCSVPRLCRKYPAAILQAEKTEAALKSVEKTSETTLVEEWKVQEAEAQANRDLKISAMDIYDLKISQGELKMDLLPQSISDITLGSSQ